MKQTIWLPSGCCSYGLRIRVVQLTNFASPYPGSFIPIQIALLRRASQRGWTVDLVLPEAAAERPWLGELDASGIPWRIARSSSRLGLARWVAGLLDEARGPTVLHTHWTLFDVPSALAVRGRRHARLIWHSNTPLRSSPAARLRNRLKLMMFARRVSAIACSAEDLRDEWIRRGAPPKKLHLLPNAIDTDRFSLLSDRERRRAREALGLPAGAPVLLHLGWDWHRKGGDIFLDALSMLRREGLGSVVGITVGGESRRGGGKLPDGAIELPPTPDVRSLYAAADVFCSPSRAEGQPYAVMEALSCGTPVVASRIPGHTLVAEGVPGCCIVPGEDPGALADAVRALLARDASNGAAEAAARNRAVADRFGIEPWSDRLLACYERLTSDIPG